MTNRLGTPNTLQTFTPGAKPSPCVSASATIVSFSFFVALETSLMSLAADAIEGDYFEDENSDDAVVCVNCGTVSHFSDEYCRACGKNTQIAESSAAATVGTQSRPLNGCLGCGCLSLIAAFFLLCSGIGTVNERDPLYDKISSGVYDIQPGMSEVDAMVIMNAQPTRSHFQGKEMGYSEKQHVLIWECRDKALMVVCVNGKVVRVRDMSGIRQNLSR